MRKMQSFSGFILLPCVVLPAPSDTLLGHQQVNVENCCGGALAVSDKMMFVWEHKVDTQSGGVGRRGVWCLRLALNSILNS